MDDDIREQEEKSLLKDIAKDGISKVIAILPLKYKLIIFGVILGVVLFLLMFIIIITPTFLILGEDKENASSNLAYIELNAEDNYWWPVGGDTAEEYDNKLFATGMPTSTTITSNFSTARTLNGKTEAHYGMDIGSSGGTDYVISVSNGVVYSVSNTCANDGNLDNYCGGGGYGNYVIIEHPGSVYTVYAHLYPDSITVSVGESVKQGQIIGTMGNSGRSTGTHLHFQIEVGGRGAAYAEDPLGYISVNNPRPVTVISGSTSSEDGQLLKMLQSWEGTGPTDGDYYVVYDDGTGVLTVGHGVTLKYNIQRFANRNIDTSILSEGSKLEKNIVDDIELEIVNEKRNDVIGLLESNNIALENYQIDALVIRIYNVGNIGAFPENYKKYGNTTDLYHNYMNKPVTGGGTYMTGLARRRQAEWNLFHNGIYTFNS